MFCKIIKYLKDVFIKFKGIVLNRVKIFFFGFFNKI